MHGPRACECVRLLTLAACFLALSLLPALGAPAALQPGVDNSVLVDTQSIPGATLYADPQSGLVKSLIGNFSYYGVSGTPEDTARLFLSDFSDVLAVPPDTYDLVSDDVLEGEALWHVRFHQDYLGIPLWGGSVVVHMTKDQVVLKVDSAYVPNVALPSLVPELNADDAAYRARALVSPSADLLALDAVVTVAPELFVYASDTATPRLVWVSIAATNDNPSGWRVMIDAGDGSLVEIYDTRIGIGYTGQGYVFYPNPVATYGGVPPNADSQRKDVPFYDLSTTAHLLGSWADAKQPDGSYHATTYPDFHYSYTDSQGRFEEAMAYYHVDNTQTYLQSIWGGSANRRVQPIYVNDPSRFDDAFYSQNSGLSYPIYLGVGYIHHDMAEDADVILHEYAHAILDDRKGHGWDFYYGSGYPDPRIQHAAVAEGHADWFACNFFAHVEPAFTNGANDLMAEWAFRPAQYLRKVTSSLTYSSFGVSPSTISDAYGAAPFWADQLWDLSQALGQKEANRLLLEWAGTVAIDTSWTEAANSLLVADNALNAGINKHAIMKTVKSHGTLSITDENTVFARAEVEHGDLAQLRVTLGVKSAGGSVIVSQTLASFGSLSGSGKKVWVQNCNGWSSYFPPSSSYVWFVRVEEKTDDTVIHDQGVIRNFYVWRGASSYPEDSAGKPNPVAWVPIAEDGVVDCTLPQPALSQYAEITLGHSDLSQLEAVLGVKDLTDETDRPGWQLRLTKNGLIGWATPADTTNEPDLHIKVDLSGMSSRLPPSLAKRWYLGIRDTGNDDHVGRLTDLHVLYNSVWYNPVASEVSVAISQTAPQYANLLASPSTTSGAYGRQTISGSNTIKVGVGNTGTPSWISGALSSPYVADISGGQGWQPPTLTNRWWWKVASGGSSGTINWFALYDRATPRIYRSAGPPVSVPAGGTSYAYVPYSSTNTFSDVGTGHGSWMYVEGLYKAGIVTNGYGDWRYHPEYLVDRASMAIFIARAHSGSTNLTGYTPPATPTFVDVPVGHQAYKFVEYCKSRGIVNGYPPTYDHYGPADIVDRGSMAVFIARAIGGHKMMSRPLTPSYSDLRSGEEECQAIEYLTSGMNSSGGTVVAGYGGGLYSPATQVDRGQMAIFVARGFTVPQ